MGTSFFQRQTRTVARELLGKRLCRATDGKILDGLITETEAYDGPHDRASHASRGRTPRTEVMFGQPGTIYVYLIYGMHWCCNIVTGREGYPAAVLIRSIAVHDIPAQATNGPGKVCRELGINGMLNAKPLGRATGLWVEESGIVVPRRHVQTTPRIGVDYAGAYRDKPWRFVWYPTATLPA